MEHARPPTELSLDGSPVSRADAWRKWKTQFLLFLKASGVHKEESAVQSSLLINLIGPDGFDVYQTLSFETETEREDVNAVLKKFDEYFGVKSNLTLARYNFFTRSQEQGETIGQYVVALKLLSKKCEFGSLEDSLIRDRIVCGIHNGIVRDRLLRMEELSLDKAIKVCEADEVSADGSRCLESRGAGPARVDAVRARQHGSRGGRRGRGRAAGVGGATSRQPRVPPRASAGQDQLGATCHGCGMQCPLGTCPAMYVKCYVCQNYGHYARQCNAPQGVKKVYDIEVHNENEDNYEDDCELFYVSMIVNISLVGQSDNDDSVWYETLTRDGGGSESFKLDTGADISVLPYKRFKALGYSDSIIQQKHLVRLFNYSEKIIPIKGICYLIWWHKNRKYCIKFAIADLPCQSVLGRRACREMGLVKRVHDVSLNEYGDLFEGLGCLPGEYSIIVDPSVPPVVSAPRKVPLALRDKLLHELNRMTDLGVIRKVTHPTLWVNSIVLAAKKNGDIRICLDPRPLNCAIRRAHFQLPTITELTSKLHGACYFSVLDANSGFWAIKLDDASADLCTFSSPFGRYQFTRLPFGINCAPEVFHAKIKQLLENLEGVDSFIDDIICWGRTKEEHEERLNALLERARSINLKFNKSKCKICVQEVTYLGHVFSKNGMKPDCTKVKAIIEMPPPSDRKSLERFLGATNYLSKFIPSYSEHTKPLTNLLKKDTAWVWDVVQQNALDKLKKLISESPVLALYDVQQPVVLSVDASSVALGAVLLQGGRPVEYASRMLTDTQTRYAQVEKEMLAILFACEKFRQYIYGKINVVIETDHKPLESLFKKPLESVPVRLQRMLMRLQGLDLLVTYKPGKYMYLADTLSRASLPEKYDENVSNGIMYQVNLLMTHVNMSKNKLKVVKDETLKDGDLVKLSNYVNKGWPNNKYEVSENLKCYWSMKDELFVVDDIIFKNNLILIPPSMRAEMLKIIHDGHLGIDRCKRRARQVLFWPGINKEIETYVKGCKVCQDHLNAPSREPLIPIEVPNLPWCQVGTDIFEYLKKYYLIIIDYYSGFVEVAKLNNITSCSVIQSLKENFSRHGIPKKLISDNGTQYTSRDFKRFAADWGFEHVTTSPNYAQANGKSERAVQTIKNILKKSIQSNSDLYLNLLSYRNTPRENLSSPAQMLMGRMLRCRLPVHPDLLQPKPVPADQYDVIVSNQQKNKRYYDQRCKVLPPLKKGDNVIMLDKNHRIRGQIVSKCNLPRSYIVKNRRGVYRRNRRHLIKCSSDISDHAKNNGEPEGEGNAEQDSSADMDRFSSAESSDESVVESHSPMITIRKQNKTD